MSATLGTEITTLGAEASRILADADFQGASVFASLTFQVSDSAGDTVTACGATLGVHDPDQPGHGRHAAGRRQRHARLIGAGQNVLDYTVQNLKSAVVNVRAAESTIRDVDMAEEMANFTKNNILKEAAQAMLGQANQGSMSILQLLR